MVLPLYVNDNPGVMPLLVPDSGQCKALMR